MAIDKIVRNIIEDNAVTEPKIAAGAVDNTAIDKTIITGLSELTDVVEGDQLLIYDTSANALKKVTKARTTTLVSPVYTSVTPSTAGVSSGTVSFTITGSGFTPGTNARLIGNGGQRRNFTSVTRNNATTLTAVFDATLFSSSETPYDIQVINGEGLSVVGANQIAFNEVPVFTTGAGSLGSGNGGSSVSFSVNATDPESAGNVTFELQSGSLPAGLSLVNTAAEGGTAIISGTATNPTATTTSNFVLRAVDAASNTSSRAFSITINRVFSYQSFTSSGTFAVPSGVTLINQVLVVAGGGGSGANHAGGGGAGGLVYMPEYPVTPGGTITVTVGCGGAGGSASDDLDNGDNGQDSVFGSPGDPGLGQGGVLTAKGGGGGGTGQSGNATVGSQGGSGGGGGGIGTASPTSGGSATQPTQPGNSGAYGFGNDGGFGLRPSPFNNYAGGGGGAGAAGESGTQGGDGGIGKAYTIADGTTSVYYAGGGGGGRYQFQACAYSRTQGGQGGGGQSNTSVPSPASATAGEANKGGGGGAPQQAGGKGIVVVRY